MCMHLSLEDGGISVLISIHGSMLNGAWGVPRGSSSDGCPIPHPIFCPGPMPWYVNVDLEWALCIVVRLKKDDSSGPPSMDSWQLLQPCDTGWPQMWPTDSGSIFHIPALICSGSSTNGWWQWFLHSDPSFPHHRTMGYPIETTEGVWDDGCLVRPMTLGDSEGDTGQKNFNPFS